MTEHRAKKNGRYFTWAAGGPFKSAMVNIYDRRPGEPYDKLTMDSSFPIGRIYLYSSGRVVESNFFYTMPCRVVVAHRQRLDEIRIEVLNLAAANIEVTVCPNLNARL